MASIRAVAKSSFFIVLILWCEKINDEIIS